MSCNSCKNAGKPVQVIRPTQQQSIKTQVVSVRANRKLATSNVKVKTINPLDKYRG